jgi:hypothetical protein
METERVVCESIKDKVEAFLAGKVKKEEFNEFVAKSNAALDKLKAEKARSAEFWECFNATYYY